MVTQPVGARHTAAGRGDNSDVGRRHRLLDDGRHAANSQIRCPGEAIGHFVVARHVGRVVLDVEAAVGRGQRHAAVGRGPLHVSHQHVDFVEAGHGVDLGLGRQGDGHRGRQRGRLGQRTGQNHQHRRPIIVGPQLDGQRVQLVHFGLCRHGQGGEQE